ncbi:MAG: hypothetical protein GX774_19055 [Armatimonadetes bacterium]|jgi:hypothetical protein|nr:hypothetical protein [Armatimonadota bacterium]
MLKQIVAAAVLLGLLVAVPTQAQWEDDEELPEWVGKLRFAASAGFTSSGVVDFLTFRDGDGHGGWNWQLTGIYRLETPYFAEAGLMGWRLGRENRDDAKEFGITLGGGARIGSTEVGIGLVPSGGRIFARHFLQPERQRQGPFVQVDLVFPDVSGASSFLDLNVGLGF